MNSFEKNRQVSYKVINFDTSGLVRRMQEEYLTIPDYKKKYGSIEGFQRNFVWKKRQMDKFIESILLGYPTPGIFLIEPEVDEFLILDGQQRLKTLYQFVKGVYKTSQSKKEQIFSLSKDNVDDEYAGLTYRKLTRSQKSSFDNYLISATVISTNSSNDNRKAVYDVFNRLNSGGTNLYEHEIRIATWAGELPRKINDTFSNLDSWSELYGEDDNRFRDHELVSRLMAVIAPKYNQKTGYAYRGSTNKLINDFYDSYYDNTSEIDFVRKKFIKICDFLDKQKTNEFNPLKPFGKINGYWCEAIFFGLSNLIDENANEEILEEKFTNFCAASIDNTNKSFKVSHFDKRGSYTKNFKDRLEYAHSFFSL